MEIRSINSKKAESTVVSYVLLIVIAIGLSSLVYAYLKGYIGSPTAECPSDIHLVVEQAYCSVPANSLLLTLSNRGLFNVSAAYVRLGKASDDVRIPLNQNPGFPTPISPGNELTLSYPTNPALGFLTQDISAAIEIVPVVYQKNKAVLCSQSIITYPLTCKQCSEHDGLCRSPCTAANDPDCIPAITVNYPKIEDVWSKSALNLLQWDSNEAVPEHQFNIALYTLTGTQQFSKTVTLSGLSGNLLVNLSAESPSIQNGFYYFNVSTPSASALSGTFNVAS